MLDRSLAPPSHSLRKFPLKKAEQHPSPSGVPVFYIHAGKEPVVRIEFIFNAGAWYEPQSGVSYFTAKMLTEGTAQHTAAQLTELVARYGAMVEVTPGNNKIIYTLLTLSKHADKLLDLVEEVLTQSVFPNQELDTLKKITRQTLEIERSKTGYLAHSGFKEVLFGKDHPYGRTPSPEAIEKITREPLFSYYKERITRDNCEVILAGEVDKAVLNRVDALLEKLPVASKAGTLPNYEPATAPEASLWIEKENSLQSSIRIGRMLVDRAHPDYFDFLLLNEIYGGYFGSRLMKNIREDKGYTYGIYSAVVSQEQAGYFVIATDVKKEVTQDAVREIYKEMALLKTEKVGEEELMSVKNYMKGTFLNTINTAFSIADKFKVLRFSGLEYDYYDNYFAAIDAATPDSIQKTACRYFDKAVMKEVIAGSR